MEEKVSTAGATGKATGEIAVGKKCVSGAEKSARGFLYRTVVEMISGMIAAGTLSPGDRVPSLREMSRKLGVSIATVMRAYEELERQGRLHTRPQSGHYVSRLSTGAPPPRAPKPLQTPTDVDCYQLICEVHQSVADPGIVPLGAAVPALELLPGRDLARVAKRIMGDPDTDSILYGFQQGEPLLRHQLSLHLLEAGAKVGADELIITAGATEGISLALKVLAQPGDTIVVESPCYFGYLLVFEALGLKALEVPTDPAEGPDLEALAKAVARPDVKAAILQPNFANPTGGLYPLEKRGEIYRTVTDAGVALIEDDLYGDLHFGERRPPSLMAEDERGMVIHVGAFSKTLSPGFRVGWIRPGRWFAELYKMKAAASLMTARPNQLIIGHYLAEGRYRRHMRTFTAKCKSQLAIFSAHIQRTFPEGTRISNPKGGFVLWVELPESVDAVALYREALKRGIGLAPGAMYSSQERYGNFVRINCGNPWSDKVRVAVETVGELVREMVE